MEQQSSVSGQAIRNRSSLAGRQTVKLVAGRGSLGQWIAVVFGCCCITHAGGIPAPRSDLRAVPLPEISWFEEAVRGQLEATEKRLREAVSREEIEDQELSDAYGVAGRTYHVYGLTDSAEACYLNASRLRPLNFAWAYLLARLYHAEERNRQALTWYLRSGLIRMDYPALFVNLGLLQLDMGAVDSAREAFETALEKSPGNTAALTGMGRVAMAKGEYRVAIHQFEEALRRTTHAGPIHRFLAEAFASLSETDRAQEHSALSDSSSVEVADALMEALQELRQGEGGFLYRGRQLSEAGHYQQAAAEFRKAVEANPGSARARIDLGSALVRAGDLGGAEQHYREALRLDPGNRNALFDLGVVLSRQGEWVRALMQFEEILGGGHDDAEVRLAIARALRAVNRSEEALRHYAEASRLDPHREDAILGEVSLLVDLRRYAEALERLNAAHALLPGEGLIAHALARLLAGCPDARLRDGNRALDLALRVYRARSTVGHAETVALALSELNRCEEAEEWQSAAIKAAEESGERELADRLRRTLIQLGSGPPCRP